jgi:hypothetical protein
MFDGNLLVRLPLTAANHGYRSSRLKELDQIFQKNQPARSRCHPEGISHGLPHCTGVFPSGIGCGPELSFP